MRQRSVPSGRVGGFLRSTTACPCSEHAKKSKKNCSANLLCVYGLGERSKHGPVWGGAAGLAEVLGADPALESRQALEGAAAKPAGLRNLGATCYLASLLQVLFNNLAFRSKVNSWPDSEDEANVVSALQRIFAELETGKRTSCGVKVLTDLLRLEVAVQQDPQEFSKLFMAMVEECVSAEGAPPGTTDARDDADNLVAELFRGKQEYVTTCRRCKRESCRTATFDELELAIAGRCSVQACLEAHLQQEVLSGDNQYFCESCDAKADATRDVFIRNAPNVLSVQLLRYVYDRVTWEKRKLRDAIETNATLAVREGDEDVLYDLVAVVLHRGESAHGGHYVTKALNWRSGASRTWHQYDDDVVTLTEPPGAVADKADTPGRRSTLTDAPVTTAATKKAEKAKSAAKSSETYMLTYVRRVWFEQQFGTGERATVRRGRGAAVPCACAFAVAPPPPKAREYADQLDLAHEERCAAWRLAKQTLTSQQTERTALYAELFGNADSSPTPFYDADAGSFHEDVRLLESEALAAWVSGALPSCASALSSGGRGRGRKKKPPPFSEDAVDAGAVFAASSSQVEGGLARVTMLRRQALICTHGKLRPDHLRRFKVLRREVYDRVVAQLVGTIMPDSTEVAGDAGADFELDLDSAFCGRCLADLSDSDGVKQQTASARLALKAALLECKQQQPGHAGFLKAKAEAGAGAHLVARQWVAELARLCVPCKKPYAAEKACAAHDGDTSSQLLLSDCANFESGPADSKDANHALVCVHGALNPQLTQPPLVVDCETSHELFKLFPHTKRLRVDSPNCDRCQERGDAKAQENSARVDELRQFPALRALLDRGVVAHPCERGSSTRASRARCDPVVDDASCAFGTLAPKLTTSGNARSSMAWVRESEERGDCEVVPRFRLVRRHWLAWWRAFHTVKGPRPPALGDHATALRCRCLQNNNNNGGDDAAARAPLWVDRVFLSRPRHHDCQDQAAACAAVAEACDQAQTIDGSVFDVAREAATLSATLVPDADPLTLADSAPADDDAEALFELVFEEEWCALSALYSDLVSQSSAVTLVADPSEWRLEPRACAECGLGARYAFEQQRREFAEGCVHVARLRGDERPWEETTAALTDSHAKARSSSRSSLSESAAVSSDEQPVRRRSQRAAEKAVGASERATETLRLASSDRVGLLMLRLCEAFPEMMTDNATGDASSSSKKRPSTSCASDYSSMALLLFRRDGAQLVECDAALETAGVRARDVLYARVVRANQHIPGAKTLEDLLAYADTADAPRKSKKGKQREIETGFSGTMLCSRAPAPQRQKPQPTDDDDDDDDTATAQALPPPPPDEDDEQDDDVVILDGPPAARPPPPPPSPDEKEPPPPPPPPPEEEEEEEEEEEPRIFARECADDDDADCVLVEPASPSDPPPVPPSPVPPPPPSPPLSPRTLRESAHAPRARARDDDDAPSQSSSRVSRAAKRNRVVSDRERSVNDECATQLKEHGYGDEQIGEALGVARGRKPDASSVHIVTMATEYLQRPA